MSDPPIQPIIVAPAIPSTNLAKELLKDVWVHIGGLVAVGFAAADLWQFHGLSRDTDLLVLAAGFLAQGVKIVNGSAAVAAAAAAGALGEVAASAASVNAQIAHPTFVSPPPDPLPSTNQPPQGEPPHV